MHFEQLAELYVFLALLFNTDISLPCAAVLKDVIFDNAAKKNASIDLEAFIKFVDHIEKYYAEIVTACSNSSSNANEQVCYLSEAEVSSANKQACIAFFNMILSEDYSPTEEDRYLLTSRIFYIVRDPRIKKCRVVEVFLKLREAKYICEAIPTVTLYTPSYDEHSCECFEYEMSGNCSHTFDDEVFL